MKLQSQLSKPVFLGAATRSPIGKFGGSLRRFSAPQLATLTLIEASRRAPGSPPDLVLLGHARQAGAGPNPARQTLIAAGLSEKIPAITLNQACASGMAAIFTAIEKIGCGRAKSIWAGGVESMSNTPYFLPNARWGLRLGHAEIIDGMHKDGFFCPMAQMLMGETVDRYIAEERGITRADQDAFAIRSQLRADLAWKSALFNAETFEILADTKDPKRSPGLHEDEHRRPDTTLASLAKLPPVFNSKTGTVSAGNSSGITDGAAFVHVSENKLPHSQVEVLDYETVALDPRYMGLGPIDAIRNILKRNSLKMDDIEVVEINEAFAAQALACQRELNISDERLNPRGGSIAIGHPIGATGARITVTLIHQLVGKDGALGIASLCVSGGQGVAILLRAL